jgi:hypothetical protein
MAAVCLGERSSLDCPYDAFLTAAVMSGLSLTYIKCVSIYLRQHPLNCLLHQQHARRSGVTSCLLPLLLPPSMGSGVRFRTDLNMVFVDVNCGVRAMTPAINIAFRHKDGDPCRRA